jgi:hypothetical protein
MRAKKSLLACACLVVFAGSLRAEPPLPLDLIPEDACIGIATRSLADLRTKSDKLLGKAERPLERPSQLLDMVFAQLNLGWKIDEKKPAAIVCMTGKLGGFGADADPNKDFTIGAVLAPESLAETARAYKVAEDELKKGKVMMVPGREFDRYFGTNFVGLQNGQMYLTGMRGATAAWMEAPKVRQGQTPARQKRLDASDGLLYFGPPLLAVAQKDADPDRPPDAFHTGDLGPQEAEAQRRVYRALLEARYVVAGYQVDDGFGLDLAVGFDRKGTNSQAVLKAVTGVGRTSNLTGLPDSDRLVGAFSAIGLNRGDLHLARVLARDLWFGMRGFSPILDSDAVALRRMFGDLYSKLKLGKVAVYHSSDPARFGQLATVLILEPANPGQFLTDILQYARLGDVEQFDPQRETTKAEIEKLVADLGSDDFETRESASTKLALVGEPAVALLMKAEKSDDAEVRRSAGDLRRAIQAAADLRRKELAEGLVKRAFRPTFTLKLKAEKRADADVHLLGMKFDAEDAPYSAALRDLLGPEWSRMRIAVVNKQVVILVGSDLALLDQAIQNVRDGKAGLEQSTALAEFHKRAAPERRIELHLALSRVRALVMPSDMLPKDFKPTATCSSVSVRTGLTDLGLDLWLPAEAVTDVLTWLR